MNHLPAHSPIPTIDSWRPRRVDTPRMTLGILATSLSDTRMMEAYNGITEVTRAAGINVICYIAGQVETEKLQHADMGRILSELIDPEALDGLLTLQFWNSRQWFMDVCRDYIHMPITTAFRNYENFCGVAVDTQRGSRSLVEHLITDHGYRRIAYIRGRIDAAVHEMRYQAFRDVCAEHQIEVQDALIVTFHDWNIQDRHNVDPLINAQLAVKILLDERGLLPGRDFDAIISSWEPIAICMVRELQLRGYRIPQDVALVSDENTQEGAIITPSLTTVGIDWHDIGRQSVKLLIEHIHDPQFKRHILSDSNLIVRRSCGCYPEEVEQAGLHHASSKHPNHKVATEESILYSLQNALRSTGDAARMLAENIFTTFMSEISQPPQTTPTEKSRFLDLLEASNTRSKDQHQQMVLLYDTFSQLRHYVIAQFPDQPDHFRRAEILLQQGQIIVSALSEHAQAYRRFEQDHLLSTLQNITQRLMSTFDIPALTRILIDNLPKLGVTRGYLSLYEDPTQPKGEARLLMAFDEHGERDIPPDGVLFPAAMLAPCGILPAEALWNLIVEPLYFGDDQIGFIVFEASTQDPRIYDLLRSEISNAIKSALLMQRINKRSADLEASNAALHESITSLKHYQNQLVRSEKMAALGQLVAGVAHEINTPIGIGVTAASFLQEESHHLRTHVENSTLRKSELTHFVDHAIESSGLILSNLSRANELVQSFKRVAVDQTFEEEQHFALGPYMHDLVTSMAPKLRPGMHQIDTTGAENISLYCAPGVLYQILSNLIMNSIVHGFEEKPAGMIQIEFVCLADTTLHIRYADNGKGMDEETLHRIFDPFFTTKRGQGGTGLGMNIVYNLITQKLQGSIDCSSTPNEGVSFNIRLPHIIREGA